MPGVIAAVTEGEGPMMVDKDGAPDIQLTEEQEAVLSQFCSGRNVFFTGCAGTGKSLLLRNIIHWCREVRQMEHSEVVVTAPTGMAAMNIGGSTIHSWAGIGPGTEPLEKLLINLLGPGRYERMANGQPPLERDVQRIPSGMQRWLACKVLIIDEISMLGGSLLDKLEAMARFIRQNSEPFGGIQLVFSGDFLQLPPIGNEEEFAFQSKCWARCIDKPMLLQTVFRQKEREFVDLLNQLRMGRATPEVIAFFQSLSRPIDYADGIEPTELFPTRFEVHTKNLQELAKLPGDTQVFRSFDKPGWDPKTRRQLTGRDLDSALKRISVPDVLQLKEGAQVMLLKNMVQNLLVNGSLGVVIGFCTAAQAFSSHRVFLGIAYGISMLTKKTFSSAATREKAEAELAKWLESPRLWPVVRFYAGRSRKETVDICCVPLTFTARHAGGGVAAFRDQVPLTLSYALTIHKAQGQTLERVKVDLARTFSPGQCYVALSRAVSADALQVLNFDHSKVEAHPKVIRWLHALEYQEYRERRRREVASTFIDTSLDDTLEFWGDDMDGC